MKYILLFLMAALFIICLCNYTFSISKKIYNDYDIKIYSGDEILYVNYARLNVVLENDDRIFFFNSKQEMEDGVRKLTFLAVENKFCSHYFNLKNLNYKNL